MKYRTNEEADKEFENEFGKDSELNKFLTLKYGTHIHHEPVMNLVKSFIHTLRIEDRTSLLAEVEGIIETMKKPKKQIPIPCQDGLLGCAVYHCKEIEPEENKLLDEIIKKIKQEE